jgi:AcrR family transcriptional regulator
MAVFWCHGFEATSMANLSAATGLNKPSLYAAFGDKAQLFRQALERYAKTQAEPHLRALDREPDLRAAIGGFLASMADVLADPAKPGGCFIVNATAACGTGDLPSSVETAVHQAHASTSEAIRQRLARAERLGQLPAGTPLDALADFLLTVVAGMAVRAKAGTPRAALDPVIAMALGAIPH